jgi:hypothetical protein
MSTVLRFRASTRTDSHGPPRDGRACEIVIFPGVRIERGNQGVALDLGHRIHPAGENFDGVGGSPQPRRTH